MTNLCFTEFVTLTISIVSALVSSLGGLLIWKYKRNVEQEMNETFESYKMRLQNESDTQIEKLRVEYGSLYGRRVEAIVLLYEIIFQIQGIRKEIADHLFHFVEEGYRDPDAMADMANRLSETIQEFSRTISRHRIYFPNRCLKLLDDFQTQLLSFCEAYADYPELEIAIEEFMREQYEINIEKFDKKVSEVETEFRSLLGETN